MAARAKSLQSLLGIELPIIQAPMAGAQGSALTIAVCEAGGLGSLPCALLGFDAIRKEVKTSRKQTARPFNVNFFCHARPKIDDAREAAWREKLRPYYTELGIDPENIPSGPERGAFNADAVKVLAEFKPPVVSFHFGLPSADLLDQV